MRRRRVAGGGWERERRRETGSGSRVGMFMMQREGEVPDPLPGVELRGADSSAANHEEVKTKEEDYFTHFRVGNLAEGVDDKGHRENAVNEMAEEDHAGVTRRVELLVHPESTPHAVVAASRNRSGKEHDGLLQHPFHPPPTPSLLSVTFAFPPASPRPGKLASACRSQDLCPMLLCCPAMGRYSC